MLVSIHTINSKFLSVISATDPVGPTQFIYHHGRLLHNDKRLWSRDGRILNPDLYFNVRGVMLSHQQTHYVDWILHKNMFQVIPKWRCMMV